MRRLYSIIAVAILFTATTFSQSKIDSILNYTYASASDSTLNSKKHYDTYDVDGNLTHKVTYKWNGNNHDMEYEESYEYETDGISVYQKVHANNEDDFRIEYTYDKDGNLTEEVVYSNKNEGEELDPEWERALKKEYSYNASDVNDTVVVSAFVKYWQPARKIGYTYNGSDNVTSEKVYKWLPNVKVKEFEGVYGQNSGSTSNYLYRAYKVEQTVTSLDELANIIVPAATTVVNIFKTDGSRVDIMESDNPGGKSLKELLELKSITLSDLKDNYREWFKTVDDDNTTLINLNIKAGRPFQIQEVVVETTDLYSYNENVEYFNTAYWVKGAATMDDLLNVTIPSDIEWINIYVKSDESDGKKYKKIDIAGADAAGKTLNAIFSDSITVDDLYQDYEEWFYNKNNERKLIRLNVKAVKVSPQGSTAIDTYKKLYAKSDETQFILNAYKVNSGATATDLGNVTISNDAYKVTVYKTGDERVDITTNIQGYTLQQIFDANSLTVSDLDQNRVEWFYNSDGQIVLLNINVKEEYRLDDPEKVEVENNLYNVGFSNKELIYENTAFNVHEDATDDDLKNYTIPADAHYVVVKRTLGRSNTYTGQEGKTLSQFMSDNSLTIASLSHSYWEWFVNTNKRRTLVKLNIKAYREVQPVPVMVVDSLFTGSNGKVFSSVAYKVASSATQSDVDAIALPQDIEYLDYYLSDETSSSLHPKDGVAVTTLGAMMQASGNNEGIDITIAQLHQGYAEWFVNNEGKTKLYKLNFKAIIQENDGSKTLTKETSLTYGTNNKEAEKIVHKDIDNSSKESWTKYNYTYNSNDDMLTELKSVSTDGSAYNNDSKKGYIIDNDDKLRVITYYGFNASTSAYELESKDFYFYEGDTPTAIDDKPVTKLSTKYYPNPVSNILNIHVQDVDSFTYKIFNIDGSIATMGSANGGTTTIDVTGLQAGVYILNIVSDSKSYTTKIVKK